MATTIGAFSAIDDSEVDSESPITESLVTRLRDNSYWIIEGTNKTTETDTAKTLRPDGAGGVVWGGGVDGTKGTVSATFGTTYVTMTSGVSGIFIFTYSSGAGGSENINGTVIVDLSDDTFTANYAGAGSDASYSGTITTGQQVGSILNSADVVIGLNFRRSGGALQYAQSTTGTNSLKASWVIL